MKVRFCVTSVPTQCVKMLRSDVLLCLTCLVSYSVFGAQITDFIDDDDIQYDIEPPQDIRVQCNSDEILVSVDTVHNVFNGMIYPMGLSKNSSCMAEFDHNEGSLKYRLPLRSCNTMSSQLDDGAIEYYNTIVVQPHRKLVTNKGRGFHVRCRYQPMEDTISRRINSSSTETSLLSARMPVVTMRIYNADSNNIVVAENVKIGDPLNIVISINDTEKTYGFYVTDCLVQDGLGWSEQHLIDGFGCPLDPEIMGQFKYDDDLTKAIVHFQAHKFPYTASVYYQCSVHLCRRQNDGCKNMIPDCKRDGDVKRRSRRQERTKNSDEGSAAMIEVYSGLNVNEATPASSEQAMREQVRQQALNDPYNFCISQHSFAVGIAVAGLILMLLAVIAILCILTKRRTPRKDISTTGSSIYSGPYTNTAYSHTS